MNVHHPARTCALCEAAPPIENSHIVPNFVIKHLKRGTPVKALIHSTAPTDFEQDAWKGPYLCEGCEQAVSRLESYFARSVYTPLLSSGLVSLRYDDRLSRFLASVHFRYLTFVAHRSHEPLPGQLERLRQDLRSAISGGLAAAPRVALYLVPLYPVRTTVYPPGANHYFFEAIDGAQFTWHRADRSAQWISYVKFPNLALFAAEESLDRAFADPALVAGHGIADAGEFSYAPATDPPAILELVRDRIERIPAKVQANYGRLSERQAASLQGQIDRHPGAASMRAGTTHQLDLDLLRAWQRERGQP